MPPPGYHSRGAACPGIPTGHGHMPYMAAPLHAHEGGVVGPRGCGCGHGHGPSPYANVHLPCGGDPYYHQYQACAPPNTKEYYMEQQMWDYNSYNGGDPSYPYPYQQYPYPQYAPAYSEAGPSHHHSGHNKSHPEYDNAMAVDDTMPVINEDANMMEGAGEESWIGVEGSANPTDAETWVRAIRAFRGLKGHSLACIKVPKKGLEGISIPVKK
ncbi:hypothetical protein BDZ94DRAFT_1241748 [Collybia nuda]|uniref:Uncharacterized protein n=1 Tax=Collybia nuda TaxID=64659 RepID=A0A9P6C8M5_9AGAR|nr:hypothetical protein BDZ94DRAFT_1241748 [Collybia nuda]